MIYTPLTNRALKVAYQAHHGQVDYNGIPYIFHPIHLAEQMDDEISCCVALLHDTVEDTDITFEELEAVFPPAVMDALKRMTHPKEVPYFDYVRGIRGNAVAVKVKLADIAHNSDQTRLAGCGMSEEVKAYFRDKYTKAKAILLEE
jgi:(p)ppGpp synthase/HD superfamily hydrolase